jgi:peptidylprolyl isomerase
MFSTCQTTDSEAFRKITDQRRNRREDWFKYNPGRIDLCNISLPVRTAAPGG